MLRSKQYIILGLLVLSLAAADNSLLFWEAQLVSGYSSGHNSMQKPSVGFDYIRKISDDTTDYGLANLQLRANWIQHERKIDITPYNAYLRFKYEPASVWIGHYRPPFGLSANESSHATLLEPLSMDVLNDELAWGVGAIREESWGDFNFAFTEGASNFTGRIGWGVLNRDNWNTGLFYSQGQALSVSGLDATYLWDNYELRGEYISHGGLLRFGLNLDEQNKLEIQNKFFGATVHELTLAYTYNVNTLWTVRTSATKSDMDTVYVAQLYGYGLF